MNEAKDCVRPLSAWLLACLGLCVCCAELGCSGLGGLHSVGTWPPFSHYWDRGPGSPSPENDTYAQTMRAHLGLNGKPAQDAKPGPARGGGNDSASPGAKDAGTGVGLPVGEESGSPEKLDGTPDVKVTLGPPEPLPGVLLASQREDRPSSPSGRLAWHTAGNDSESRRDRAVESPAAQPVLASDSGRRALEPAGGDAAVAVPGEGAILASSAAAPAHAALAGSDEGGMAAGAELAEEEKPAAGEEAKRILTDAVAKLEALKSYQVKMVRRERVGGVVQPEEDIVLSIRRKPRAVRLEWTGGSSKGREVIFSPTLDEKIIYVHQPATAVVVPSLKIAVDSPLVMKNSRHSIADAGFDTILENMRKSKPAREAGKSGTARLDYKGLEKTEGLERPCHHFVRHTASEETWDIYLDPRSLLPRLVIAENAQGDLLERYVYSDIRENPNDLASADAFDPGERWGDGKGFFSRIAKAARGSNLPSNNASTTR